MLILFVAVILVAGLSACQPEPEAITIISASSPSWMLHFAKDQNYFTRNGLDVTITDNISGGRAILEAMARGEGQMAATTEFPFVDQAFQQTGISIITGINKMFTMSVVGCKERGVYDVTDLKGRKVGLVRSAISEFYLGRQLDLKGLSIRDVILVNVTNNQTLSAMKTGQVDAVITVEPYVNQLKEAY